MRQIQDCLRDMVEDVKAVGMRKRDIATSMGITPQQFSNLLSGHSDWSATNIAKFCAATNSKIVWPEPDQHNNDSIHRMLELLLNAGVPWSSTIRQNIESLYKDMSNTNKQTKDI